MTDEISITGYIDPEIQLCARARAPQARDMFNPKVGAQTCGIIQKLYETRQNTNMRLIKSVVGGFPKI